MVLLLGLGSFVSITQAAPGPEPTLKVGTEVTLKSLEEVTWVKGEGPKAFEPGKVYVFECWATWCAPCVASIPRLNELHKAYAEKGLRVYGMNVWEESIQNVKGLEKVQQFVKAKGDGMSYPVAYTSKESAFEKEWMTGVGGIPQAFVVIEGKVVLITHPSYLTNENIELLLTGPEGVKKVVASIADVVAERNKVPTIYRAFQRAKKQGNSAEMKQQLDVLKALDPKSPYLPMLEFPLAEMNKDWALATKMLDAMRLPDRNANVFNSVVHFAEDPQSTCPKEYMQTLLTHYEKFLGTPTTVSRPIDSIYPAIMYGRIDDIANAKKHAQQALSAAKRSASPKRRTTVPVQPYEKFAQATEQEKVPSLVEFKEWVKEATPAGGDPEN